MCPMTWLLRLWDIVDGWAKPDQPWYMKLANLVVTSGTHGLITYGAGLIGYAREAAVGYVVFKEGAPTLIPYLRKKKDFPTGWVLADSIADAAIPVAVWLLFFH